jgi:hypothetical protein
VSVRDAARALVFATGSGGTTIDRDAHGGNPFATALIKLADQRRVSWRRFPERLRALTAEASHGHQRPEWTPWPDRLEWSFQPPANRSERRCALVMAVSAYTTHGLPPLGGAAYDERRLSAVFAAHGFTVVQGVAPTRAALLRALAEFGRLSRRHDIAIVYATGHGVERDGAVHLLPADYALAAGCSSTQLRTKAVSVDRMAMAGRASTLNLVFFAGCRTQVVS